MPEKPTDRSKPVTDDIKSRMDQAVPHPVANEKLTEEEKRGMELQGEVEHAMGERREEIGERAEGEADGENQ